ncbi:MAG: prepilin-type N-terminal cleavage/methylation domain-containing protein [Candidatus Omnitrophota bacterium]
MRRENSSGVTLIENLISIVLISTLLIGITAAFFVSRMSAARARHRIVAAGIAKEWLEKELATRCGGYGSGGYEAFNPGTDSTRADPVDNITYTVTRYPETPPTLYEPSGDLTGIPYTTIGFKVTWQESSVLSGASVTCNEKVVTHVARH